MVETLGRHPGKSLLTGFVLFTTIPAAALLLVVSAMGLPLGLVLGALYAVALFAGLLITAFFVGDTEAKLVRSGPVLTGWQHALPLLAGVLTLALARSLIGGLTVFVSVVIGLGALAIWASEQYAGLRAHAAAPGA